MFPLIFLRVRNLILNPRKMTQVLLGLFLVLYLITTNLLYFAEIGNPNANIKSYGDSLWLTAITFATIGYGDRYAVTCFGRTHFIHMLNTFKRVCQLGITVFLLPNPKLAGSRYSP